MCVPLIAVVAVAAVASAAISAVQMGMAYSAQKQQAEMTRRNAQTAAADTDRADTLREVQEQDATSQQLHQQDIGEARAVANTENAFAASGVSGLSLDALTTNVHNQAEANRTTLNQNYSSTVAQLQDQSKAAGDLAVSRIDSSPPPSAFGLGLSILGTGLNGFAKYEGATNGQDPFAAANSNTGTVHEDSQYEMLGRVGG